MIAREDRTWARRILRRNHISIFAILSGACEVWVGSSPRDSRTSILRVGDRYYERAFGSSVPRASLARYTFSARVPRIRAFIEVVIL